MPGRYRSTAERMTGLEVIEVNIAVTDIQIAGAEDGTEAPGARYTRASSDHPRAHPRPVPPHAVLTTETRMSAAAIGLLAGLILGVAGSIGGFGPFLITLVVGVVGLLVGMALDGRLDVTALLGCGRDR